MTDLNTELEQLKEILLHSYIEYDGTRFEVHPSGQEMWDTLLSVIEQKTQQAEIMGWGKGASQAINDMFSQGLIQPITKVESLKYISRQVDDRLATLKASKGESNE